MGRRTLNAPHNNEPTTAAFDWVDASTVVHATNPVGDQARSVVCTVDGTLTMVSEEGNTLALVATASPIPLPYSPYRITAVTGTFFLLY